ncbi:probable pectinesterase 29 isoform X2 [Salvia splendens]|uniref:probable pectinesterase 29 isoform X2 n=1 Tax=Salvia splendens TaxID=180675 RepID=UPI001C27B06D|nr:probable pectinesterase 29 isoform X2 [Salvia splendens]
MSRFMVCALFICTLLFICDRFTNGIELEDIPTINVDKSQNSSFSSIQAAINSVPSNNKKWISISVSAGVYKEKVEIPSDKPFIYVKGEGMGRTRVVWNGHGSILTSATFTSLADNILVSGITFMNAYNYPPSKNVNPVMPAVAARISGDQSAFHECGFLGYQDTLLDDKGKHYFSLCTVEGAVDFIFGNGQSIYELHRQDIPQTKPVASCSNTAVSAERATPSLVERGRLTPESFTTLPLSQTSLFHEGGTPGISSAMSNHIFILCFFFSFLLCSFTSV